MADCAIVVKNLCKSYKIVDSSQKGITKKYKEHLVLDDVNFSIGKGEVIGIVGNNGSGKSTLLSILSKIIEPDSGSVEYYGKIASILELNMGFHTDLSGKENIYLKSELYGLSKKQVDSIIDEIIDFAELHEYIDSPIRTYSSGMISRLAFSILTHVDADILIIDEVLSTGDYSFSTKAKEYFRHLSKSNKTIILVSHTLSTVELICDRTLWLENGKIVADGQSKKICALYTYKQNNDPDLIKSLAKSGSPEAQYKLSKIYKDEENESEYEFWLKKSANNGYPEAQVKYADILHARGHFDQAFELYESAASFDNNDAKIKISNNFNKENNKNQEELIHLFESLSKYENAYDLLKYGELLLKTSNNDNNLKNAFKILTKSAELGNMDALFQLSLMHKDGIGTKRNIPMMVDCLKRASENNHIRSIIFLADSYYYGKILPKDDELAFEYYLRSAKLGIPKSQYQIATMYRDGIGTIQNKDESKRWFEIYSNSNYAPYQIIAADSLRFLNYSTETTAKKLYEKAAKTYNVVAMTQLGIIERDGINSQANYEISEKWLKQTLPFLSTHKLQLAELYYRQSLFDNHTDEMISIYKNCMAQGDGLAAYRLYQYYTSIGKLNEAYKYLTCACKKGIKEALMTRSYIPAIQSEDR